MKIVFDCLGFYNTYCHIEKDGRLYGLGYIQTKTTLKFDNTMEFSYMGMYSRYLNPEEIPTPEQVVKEYLRQLKELRDTGESCSINTEIEKAG